MGDFFIDLYDHFNDMTNLSYYFWSKLSSTDIFVDKALYLLSIGFLFGLLLFGLLILSKRIYKWLASHMLPSFLFVWFLGIVVYCIGFTKMSLGVIAILPRAILSSFKMFAVANELARVSPALQGDFIYMACFSVIHFMAACLTFVFVFKMIGFKISAAWKILYKRFKSFFCRKYTLHLFWGVNEHSLSLSESIRESESVRQKEWKSGLRKHLWTWKMFKQLFDKPQKSTIVFIDIDIDCDDSQKKTSLSRITNTITISDDEMERMRGIDALVDHCFDGPARISDKKAKIQKESISLMKQLRLYSVRKIVQHSEQVYFYFLSDDEMSNIQGAIRLYEDIDVKNHRPGEADKYNYIYVHARKDVKNEVFDHYSQYYPDEGRTKIKVVDSAYLAVDTLKNGHENNIPLPVECMMARMKRNGKKKENGLLDTTFTALLLGFGSTGQESFKFLYEFSALLNKSGRKVPFRCHAIDAQMNKISGHMIETIPDIIKKGELNLIQDSVDSSTFWHERISPIIRKLDYVVVALNDDNVGLSFAVRLFKYALRKRDVTCPMLHIMLRCYQNANEQRMQKVIDAFNKLEDGHFVRIHLFGKESDIYNHKAIVMEDVYTKAKKYHWVYENGNSELPNNSKEITSLWENQLGKNKIDGLKKEDQLNYANIYNINRKIGQDLANVQHARTKLMLMDLWGDDKEKTDDLNRLYGIVQTRKKNTITYKCEKDEDQLLLRNLARVEHERWLAAHRLLGFKLGDEQNMISKNHPDMVSWSRLSTEEKQSYDCNVVDTTIRMYYQEKMNAVQENVAQEKNDSCKM